MRNAFAAVFAPLLLIVILFGAFARPTRRRTDHGGN